MIENILVFFVFISILVPIIVFITVFNKNKKQKDIQYNNNLPFKKIIRFTRINPSIKLEIGQELNLYEVPKSDKINIYAPGTSGNTGLVGYTYNSFIHNHLSNTENLFEENSIKFINEKHIDLEIYLYVDENKAIQNIEEYKTKRIDTILKKYRPISDWGLRFLPKEKIDLKDVVIKISDKEFINDFYNEPYKAIWLENSNNIKIPVENYINTPEAIKTLRTSYSGHTLKIKRIEKDRAYFIIIVGI